LHAGDLVRAAVIAAVTAVGRSTIREVLLSRHPISWIEDSTYLFVILGVALTLLYVRFREPSQISLLIPDALGLSL
jgi:uncharacterized membrane protein YeiH